MLWGCDRWRGNSDSRNTSPEDCSVQRSTGIVREVALVGQAYRTDLPQPVTMKELVLPLTDTAVTGQE
jgi:hypothetical protein